MRSEYQNVYLGATGLLQGLKSFVVSLDESENSFLPEYGPQSLVLAVEAQSNEAVPLLEIDGR